jgi:hypothetical protein
VNHTLYPSARNHCASRRKERFREVTDKRAVAHRRIGQAEHGVERRMKNVASEVGDPAGFRGAADEISDRADEHLRVADRIERDAKSP